MAFIARILLKFGRLIADLTLGKRRPSPCHFETDELYFSSRRRRDRGWPMMPPATSIDLKVIELPPSTQNFYIIIDEEPSQTTQETEKKENECLVSNYKGHSTRTDDESLQKMEQQSKVAMKVSLIWKSTGSADRVMDYELEAKNVKERALAFLVDDKGWKKSSKSNEHWVIEYKPSDKHDCNVYRVTHWLKAPLEVIEETVTALPGSKRKEWDEDLKEVKLIQQISDNTILYVLHTNSVAKGLITPREFVDVATTDRSDDRVLITGGSVDYPDIESDKRYIRGINGCFLIQLDTDPNKPDYVRVTSVLEMDLKGRLPRNVVNATTPKVLVSSFSMWRKYLQKQGHPVL